MCSFRLAVTARRYSSADSKVVDAETSWYTVTCWRGLAENAVSSLAKGQGVVVQGRLRVRDFVHEGQPRTSADLTADALGHDLTWGTTAFTANRRSRAEETRDDTDRTEADALATAVSVGEVDGARRPRRAGGDSTAPAPAGLDAARPLVDTSPTRSERRGGRGGAVRRVGPALRQPVAWGRGGVHLHHVQGAQGARRQGHPRRRHPELLPGRQDRRRRPQRRRQVDDPQDHGRPRPAVQRRGAPVARLQRRHPHAGAAR